MLRLLSTSYSALIPSPPSSSSIETELANEEENTSAPLQPTGSQESLLTQCNTSISNPNHIARPIPIYPNANNQSSIASPPPTPTTIHTYILYPPLPTFTNTVTENNTNILSHPTQTPITLDITTPQNQLQLPPHQMGEPQ